jgi:hypothetical protein
LQFQDQPHKGDDRQGRFAPIPGQPSLEREHYQRARLLVAPCESEASVKIALTVAGFITQNPDSAGKATGAAAAVSLENPKEYTAANSGQRNGCRHE